MNFSSKIEELISQRDALLAEVKALRRDAERYRLLRQLNAGGIQVYETNPSALSFIGEELDAATDAALAARPGDGG